MCRSLFALLLVFLMIHVRAQDCSGGRYTDPIFPEVVKTPAVPFGSNIGVLGNMQTLLMDVYEPEGDLLAARPVVIIAYGGSFISGQRSDVESLCREFAKRGFVAVAPDYRVGFFNVTAANTMQAVMRGAHDLKACVRFMRRSVAENGDPWHIDTTRIMVGGVSAGAISALHAAYLNDESEMPVQLLQIASQIGGIEGNSGNAGYSSSVLGCFSFSGAIGDTLWIEAGDPPLVSVHETGDQVVPYVTQPVTMLGIPTGIIASGSHDIHLRMQHLGNPNCLLTYVASGHVGYLISDPITSTDLVFHFLADLSCGEDPGCGMLTADVPETLPAAGFSMFPNPCLDELTIDSERAGTLTLYDVNGRAMKSLRLQPGKQVVELSDLPVGAYTVRIDQGRPLMLLKVAR